jgi:hypothetical protein
MAGPPRRPADLARRFAAKRGRNEDVSAADGGTWRRETFRLPREKARETAREWFDRYPKAAYLTQVETWRVLDDGLIEFTMRRLPSAD